MTEENSVDVCVADRQTVRSEDISFLSTAIEEHDRLSARESQLLDRIRRWRQRAVCSEVGIPADELRAELDTYEEDVLLAKSELLSLARSMAGNKARLAMLMGALSRIEDREMAAVKLQMVSFLFNIPKTPPLWDNMLTLHGATRMQAFRQALSHLFDIKDARSRERRAQQVDALPIFSPTGPPDREGCRLHEHRSGALRVSVHQVREQRLLTRVAT